MVLWHRQYLDCCKELNQWDVVNEYAKVSNHKSGPTKIATNEGTAARS